VCDIAPTYLTAELTLPSYTVSCNVLHCPPLGRRHFHGESEFHIQFISFCLLDCRNRLFHLRYNRYSMGMRRGTGEQAGAGTSRKGRGAGKEPGGERNETDRISIHTTVNRYQSLSIASLLFTQSIHIYSHRTLLVRICECRLEYFQICSMLKFHDSP
jgi:hypothetical protein